MFSRDAKPDFFINARVALALSAGLSVVATIAAACSKRLICTKRPHVNRWTVTAFAAMVAAALCAICVLVRVTEALGGFDNCCLKMSVAPQYDGVPQTLGRSAVED